MKTLSLTALLCGLVLCAGCRERSYDPLSTGDLQDITPTFDMSLQYTPGGLRVVFTPNLDVTIARVVIMKPRKARADTVVSPDPSRVFRQGRTYALDGYVADTWGSAGDVWKFVLTGIVEPTGTHYVSPAEWDVPES